MADGVILSMWNLDRLARRIGIIGAMAVGFVLWPQTATAMSPDDARHLLHRTGFGVSASQWQLIIDLDYDRAVDLLVEQSVRGRMAPPPEWVDDTPLWTIVQRGWTTEQRRELRQKKRARIAELRQWWINQMLSTQTPLQERMTLFWSNHFTTQYSKIYAPMLVFQQQKLLRKHALGRFDQMLLGVLRDPAMLLYLDNDKNNANAVNENLARELMELFTLGEGHYTERDVKEAARSLTGWGVVRSTGEFKISSKRHDNRVKTVLGTKGNFSGDDLARLLLAQSVTAERVVRKLWLEFISLEPDEAMVSQWAEQFSKDDYRVDKLLKTIFKSAPFKSPENRGSLIKSPVELYVGLMRPALDGLTHAQVTERVDEMRAGRRLIKLLEYAGQNLFDPPSVEGWPGGLEWIDSRTLLSREQTARNLVLGLSKMTGTRENPYLAYMPGLAPRKSVMAYLNAIDPVTVIPQSYIPQRQLLEYIRDPAVHVK